MKQLLNQEYSSLTLSLAELTNPYGMLREYFRDYHYPELRKMLDDWFTAVYKEPHWKNRKFDVSDLHFFHERTVKLLEVTWILSQNNNERRPANLDLPTDDEETAFNTELFAPFHCHSKPFTYFPRALSMKEYLKPYKVYPKVFTYQNLPKWKEDLGTMLHCALSEHQISFSNNDLDTFNTKKYLEKLIDASHLIDIRELTEETTLSKKSNAPDHETKEYESEIDEE